MECEEFILSDCSPPDNRIQSERAKRANSWIMECEEFILPDWSPPDDPIQSERAKHANSSIMECEEFILSDWSPPDDPKASMCLVMMMMILMMIDWYTSSYSCQDVQDPNTANHPRLPGKFDFQR